MSEIFGAVKRVKVKSAKCIGNFEDEYVYDIGIKDPTNHWFFGDDILVHNSVYVTFEGTPSEKLSMTDKVKLADEICENINNSFSEFCQKTFNVDDAHGNLIRCAREVVYKSGLLLAKKHYALLVTDNEGNDVTHNDLGGHIKLRGLDLVRADTSPEIKKLLTKVLELILTNGTKSDVEDVIIDFLKKYNDKNTWEKGAPKSVRNISDWEEKLGIVKGDYTV